KLKFKWGFIPYPHTWHDADGVADFDMGLKVVKPSFSMPEDLSIGFGLQVSPGLKFYECIHTYLAIPLMFENHLRHENGKYLYSLDFHLKGDLHFALEIPFLGTKDWKIGSIFNEKWNIYKKDPNEIDERDMGNVVTGGEIHSAPAVSEGGALFGTSNDGKLYRMEYSEERGLEKKSTEFLPNTYSARNIEVTSPLLNKWAFNCVSASYVDPASGEKIYNMYVLGNWNRNFPQKITAMAMGKSDAGEAIVFVGFADGQVHCYEVLSGERLWTNSFMEGRNAIVGITVASDGALVILANSIETGVNSVLFSLDQQGTISGPQVNFAGATRSIPTINAQGQIIFATDDVLHLYEVDPASGSSERSDTRFQAGGEITTDIVVAKDGLLYFGCADHKLYCVNTTGHKQWDFDAGSAVTSTPVVGADGNVYFGTTGGMVYAVATYDEEDTDGNVVNRKGDKIWQSPVDPSEHRGPL
ncbi:MAG TPA: PQQ-binding-like beta-propeller repeat protein, partial [Thermotogota bacterium]|nr:PQQ-binding-like beta-propeller repeat protein [Thermotogota bacterium]